jgi:hypothetical protein
MGLPAMLIHASNKAVRVRVTPDLIELFVRHRVHSAQRSRRRWAVGDALSVNRNARIEPYSHILEGRTLPAAIGAFAYAWGRLEPTMRIGRYSSMAPLVSQLGMGHPADWISSSPFSHNPQPLDVRDPEGFLDRFEQALADGIIPLDPPVLTGQDIIAAGETDS